MLPDEDDIASAAPQRPDEPEVSLNTAREIYPFQMDKDFRSDATVFDMDLRPKADPEPPKVQNSSAQDYAIKSTSVTGLEDVSEEDLDDPVRTNAMRVTSKETTSESGLPTS